MPGKTPVMGTSSTSAFLSSTSISSTAPPAGRAVIVRPRVHRVVAAEIPRDVLTQPGDGPILQPGQLEPGGAAQVHHVRSGAAREGMYRDTAVAGAAEEIVVAEHAEISIASSRSSTRMMPHWPNTASWTASEPVRWPVWAWDMARPSSLRPTLMSRIGTRARAAASAASTSVRPSLNPSTYPAMAPVSGREA
jgi:hypothetical protein